MDSPLSIPRKVLRSTAKYAFLTGVYAYMAGYHTYAGISKLLGGSPSPLEHSERAPLKAWEIKNQGLEPIQHFRFNDASSLWEVVPEESTRPLDATVANEGKLHIVAYNVLSAPPLNVWTCDTARWNYILDVELPNTNADVFLLSEVHEQFWRMAQERDWIRQSYYITDYHFNNGPRNNMIISRVPLHNVSREMKNARRSIIARLGSNDSCTAPLWVSCTHLHAQFNGHLIRRHQLNAMYSYLENTVPNHEAVLIMGDLNFHREEENINIAEPYFDVYRSLFPVPDDLPNDQWSEDQLGITFDAERNPFVASVAPSFRHRMRLDRALLRQAEPVDDDKVSHIWKPLSMRVFAKDPISPSTPDLLPSDHYALELILERAAH